MNSGNFSPMRTMTALLGLAFVALIVWAFANADFFASFSAIAGDPWGVVSLADLYLGFFLFAVVIVLFDGWKATTFIWLLLLFMLGNAVAALWLVLRWHELRERMKPSV